MVYRQLPTVGSCMSYYSLFTEALFTQPEAQPEQVAGMPFLRSTTARCHSGNRVVLPTTL